VQRGSNNWRDTVCPCETGDGCDTWPRDCGHRKAQEASEERTPNAVSEGRRPRMPQPAVHVDGRVLVEPASHAVVPIPEAVGEVLGSR
jgi:hypothetical protein